MNSSALSSNNNFSSLNDSSRSLTPCCSHQRQYEKIYQQLSTLRMEHRALNQQTQVLRNTVKGIQEQNQLLKNFLNSKKQIINRLNVQNNNSNQQINRLQDQLNNIVHSKGEVQKQLEQLKQKINFNEDQSKKYLEEHSNMVKKYEYMQRQSKIKKQEKCEQLEKLLSQKDKFIEEINHSLKVNLSNFQKSFFASPRNASEAKLSQNNQSVSNFMFKRSINNDFTNISSISSHFNSLFHRYQQQKLSHQNQLMKKDKEIEALSTKILKNQTQMSQSMELFEQQMVQINTLKLKIKQKDNQHQRIMSSNRQKNKDREDFHQHIIKKLIHLIKHYFINETNPVFDSLLTVSTNLESKKFQAQILLNEINNLTNSHHFSSLKTSLQQKQFDRLNRDNRELQERLQLLTLKYTTLERQYGQIIEDNNRLIKYNSLSQYRVNRNLNIINCKNFNKQGNNGSETTPILGKYRQEINGGLSSNKQNFLSTCNI